MRNFLSVKHEECLGCYFGSAQHIHLNQTHAECQMLLDANWITVSHLIQG